MIMSLVVVDLKVITEYKISIPVIYKSMKEIIPKEIAEMTRLEVMKMNVAAINIKINANKE